MLALDYDFMRVTSSVMALYFMFNNQAWFSYETY